MLPDTTGVQPVKQKEFSVMPKGEYSAVITKIEEGISTKMTPFINFEFTITEGEYKTRKVWRRVWLQGETEEKTKTCLGIYAGILESLGMSQEQRHSTRDIQTLQNYAVGLNVKIDVGLREYNGKMYNDVLDIQQTDVPF